MMPKLWDIIDCGDSEISRPLIFVSKMPEQINEYWDMRIVSVTMDTSIRRTREEHIRGIIGRAPLCTRIWYGRMLKQVERMDETWISNQRFAER